MSPPSPPTAEVKNDAIFNGIFFVPDAAYSHLGENAQHAVFTTSLYQRVHGHVDKHSFLHEQIVAAN